MSQKEVRRLLRVNQTGMTVRRLAQTIGITEWAVRRQLAATPDVYIKDWNPATSKNSPVPFIPVYAVAIVPPNAPKP